jgi:hypothetical protein
MPRIADNPFELYFFNPKFRKLSGQPHESHDAQYASHSSGLHPGILHLTTLSIQINFGHNRDSPSRA